MFLNYIAVEEFYNSFIIIAKKNTFFSQILKTIYNNICTSALKFGQTYNNKDDPNSMSGRSLKSLN